MKRLGALLRTPLAALVLLAGTAAVLAAAGVIRIRVELPPAVSSEAQP